MDVNKELRFLWKLKIKNYIFFGGVGVGSGGGGRSGWGVRVDVNREVKFL